MINTMIERKVATGYINELSSWCHPKTGDRGNSVMLRELFYTINTDAGINDSGWTQLMLCMIFTKSIS